MKTTPIVILHGWGLSQKRFEPLTQKLRTSGYQVYSFDFPGFGESGIPKDPMKLADYAAFLADYLAKHKIQKPILLGHSFGGRVALKFQEVFPGFTKALVLTGTPGFTPTPRRRLMLFIAIAKVGKFIFSLPGISYIQDNVRRWYYYLVGAREFYRAEGAMRETFKNIVAEPLEKPMKAVRVPTLLVWGELDQITPVWIAKKMHEAIANSKLIIIPEANHGVPYRDPALFIKAIRPFIDAV